MRCASLIVLALGLAAGVAHADPLKTGLGLHLSLGQVKAAPMSPVPLAYASRVRPLPEGVARTSVEQRFGRDDTVAQAGLLCGLMPHPDIGGAQAAYGADPDGKFVGAKLSRTF
jgi:hypothetical protein